MSFTSRLISRRAYFVFCDESGNSGNNLLEEEQPLFVSACWIVGAPQRAALRQSLDGVRAVHPQKEAEIKSAFYLGEKANEARLSVVADWLGRVAGIPNKMPAFFVAERRFVLVGKIVDVLFDPAHNSAAIASMPLLSHERRSEATNAMYETFDYEVLTRFARAYQILDAEGLSSAVAALAAEARAKGRMDLALLFDGAAGQLGVILDAEKTDIGVTQTTTLSTRQAINFPGLLHMLRIADKYLDFKAARDVRVIHDRQRQFQTLFRDHVRMLGRIGPDTPFMHPEGPVDRYGLRNIKDIEFADSKAWPEIQAADLLAGAAKRMINIVLKQRSWAETGIADRRIFWMLHGFLAYDATGVLFGSEALKALFWDRLAAFAEYLTNDGEFQLDLANGPRRGGASPA